MEIEYILYTGCTSLTYTPGTTADFVKKVKLAFEEDSLTVLELWIGGSFIELDLTQFEMLTLTTEEGEPAALAGVEVA